jgi:adenylate cyclase
MGIEIERKFLLANDAWRALVHAKASMAQGYLGGTHCSIRVRVADNGAFLNIKSRELGVQRTEFEYAIPQDQAQTLLREFSDGAAIIKTRHYVNFAGMLFEIDEFAGANAGLLVAEVELQDANQLFERPDWLGVEVTDDARYYNSNLVAQPFSLWAADSEP